MKNLYNVFMDNSYIRDTEMFHTEDMTDEELKNIDKGDPNCSNWGEMEPIPYIGTVTAESEEEACELIGKEKRYDPRVLFAAKIDTKRLSLPLQPGYNLVAEIGEDKKFKEIYIGVEKDDGEWYQDLALVGESYNIDKNLKVNHIDNRVRVVVWGKSDDEDYTESYDIDIYDGE